VGHLVSPRDNSASARTSWSHENYNTTIEQTCNEVINHIRTVPKAKMFTIYGWKCRAAKRSFLVFRVTFPYIQVNELCDYRCFSIQDCFNIAEKFKQKIT
jgi:hypothetical protein